jgi:hypothetical protein
LKIAQRNHNQMLLWVLVLWTLFSGVGYSELIQCSTEFDGCIKAPNGTYCDPAFRVQCQQYSSHDHTIQRSGTLAITETNGHCNSISTCCLPEECDSRIKISLYKPSTPQCGGLHSNSATLTGMDRIYGLSPLPIYDFANLLSTPLYILNKSILC